MGEAQYEKVEKGLECCEPYLWQHCHRKQCPYYNDNGCLEAQMADALALIRQQQERIAELEAAQKQEPALVEEFIKTGGEGRMSDKEKVIKNLAVRIESDSEDWNTIELPVEQAEEILALLKEQEAVKSKTISEELKQKMWDALFAEEDKFDKKYAGTKEHDNWFLIYRPWLQDGFNLAINAIADWEGRRSEND